MAEKTPAKDQQPQNNTNASTTAAPPEQQRKFGFATLLILVVVAVAAAAGGYYFHDLGRSAAKQPTPPAQEQLAPVLAQLSPDNAPSSSELLSELGKSPADPSRVLFPAFDKPSESDSGTKAKSCPPAGSLPAGADAMEKEPKAALREAVPLGSTAQPAMAGKALTAPAISSRGPGDASAPEKPPRGKKEAQAKARDAQKKTPAGDAAAAEPESEASPAKESKTADAPASEAKVPAGTAAKARDTLDQSRPEQFQLPGSLVVKIQGYAGTTSRWGLMVVLDDSAAMAKKTRVWQPNRLQTGLDFIAKLPEALPPNCRLAVRDFMCPQADATKKRTGGTCPSHILYDWADNPFKGLKDKLQNVQPGGLTDPCGAAAYALRKDLSGMKNEVPRVLLITSGAGKCSAKELLHALDDKAGRDHTQIDLLALGMPKKREVPYAAVVRKSKGLLLKLDRPTDMDHVLARYGKVLKAKAREKIEVRSDKTVFASALDEELTLPPGTYTVTLPPVSGLEASRRVIANIKVGSGEAKVVEVPLKKGRSGARSGKK